MESHKNPYMNEGTRSSIVGSEIGRGRASSSVSGESGSHLKRLPSQARTLDNDDVAASHAASSLSIVNIAVESQTHARPLKATDSHELFLSH